LSVGFDGFFGGVRPDIVSTKVVIFLFSVQFFTIFIASIYKFIKGLMR